MYRHSIASTGLLVGLLAILPAAVLAQTVSSTAQFKLQTSTSAYRLGPGDTIEMSAANLPDMTTNRVILTDGTVTLPIIGSIRLSGLSQGEASDELTDLYRPYLKEPRITVSVLNPRPLNVTVLGEVNRPGPYTLGSAGATLSYLTSTAGTSTNNNTGQGSIGGVGGGRLTVSQALGLAGGVTEVADIEKILLIRPLPGGQKSRISVNLWSMIQNAETAQDLPLLDGDALVIPKAEPNKVGYDANLVNTTTFAPSTVEVKVVGEVNRPGFVSVAPGARMTDALVAAGGLNNDADYKAVQLFRLNPDGTMTAFQLEARLEEGRDPVKNPSLRKGDLVRVPRSFGAGLIKGLQDVVSPLYLINLFRDVLRVR